MPPLPRAVPAPPATASSAASTSTISSMSDASASSRGSAVNSPAVSVSSTSRSAPTRCDDQRGEAVVVAEADLVVGDGVVLVDDRHHAEVEQAPQRLARVQVLRAHAEVVRREQHLAGDEPVRAEDRAEALHQARLADRGDRLQRADVGRARRSMPERGQAGGDRARAHEHDLVPGGTAPPRARRRACASAASSSSPCVRRDRRRADLDDRDRRRSASRASSEHEPLDVLELDRTDAHDVALGAPARASARSTPILRNRSCTYSSASRLVRSAMATTRSAARPLTRHAPSSSRSTEKPSSAGRCTTNGSGSGSSARRPSIERAEPPEELVEALSRVTAETRRAAVDVSSGRRRRPSCRHEARPLEQLGPVAAELVEQHRSCSAGGRSSTRREVEEQHEHPRPLDVAEELVPEAAPLGRALDEAGDVGDHELVVLEAHDAEVRLERGERVVGDLRLRRARPPRSTWTCPRSGTRRARRRRAASARGASQRSSPYSPCSAKLGARRAFDRKRALPRPPRPPRAASQRSPWRTRSASTSPSRGLHRACPRAP